MPSKKPPSLAEQFAALALDKKGEHTVASWGRAYAQIPILRTERTETNYTAHFRDGSSLHFVKRGSKWVRK